MLAHVFTLLDLFIYEGICRQHTIGCSRPLSFIFTFIIRAHHFQGRACRQQGAGNFWRYQAVGGLEPTKFMSKF